MILKKNNENKKTIKIKNLDLNFFIPIFWICWGFYLVLSIIYDSFLILNGDVGNRPLLIILNFVNIIFSCITIYYSYSMGYSRVLLKYSYLSKGEIKEIPIKPIYRTNFFSYFTVLFPFETEYNSFENFNFKAFDKKGNEIELESACINDFNLLYTKNKYDFFKVSKISIQAKKDVLIDFYYNKSNVFNKEIRKKKE